MSVLAMTKPKRVTGPLDDQAKARLVVDRISTEYPGSGGTDHDTPCLSGLVHAFLQLEASDDSDDPNAADAGLLIGGGGGSSDDDGGGGAATDRKIERILALLSPPAAPRCRLRLLSDASAAVAALSVMGPTRPALLRAVAARLRALGHNAGICKARWDASGGLAAGSYEYIDVVVPSAPPGRYIVELDFAAEFEIARPTGEYGRLAAALPAVTVAAPEEVAAAVRVVAEAARRSLRSRDLHLPPWRKARYMLNKWVGPYKRTVGPLPGGGAGVADVTCRTVGFGPGLGRLVAPAARTR